MARKPAMFGRMTVNRFPEFEALIENASMRHLDIAGRIGSQTAKQRWDRNRTGESRRKIGWYRAGKEGAIYVGTVQGSIQEYGTGSRSGPRGSVQPLGALRDGLRAALEYMKRGWKA